MQYPAILSRAFVGLLALSACARPTSPDQPVASADDSGELDPGALEAADELAPGEAGAGNENSAATPAAHDQTGCADADHDAVCDSDDNCPTSANPGQEDGDHDAIGDACESSAESPASVCSPEPVPASLTAGDAELSNVRKRRGLASRRAQRPTPERDDSLRVRRVFAADPGSAAFHGDRPRGPEWRELSDLGPGSLPDCRERRRDAVAGCTEHERTRVRRRARPPGLHVLGRAQRSEARGGAVRGVSGKGRNPLAHTRRSKPSAWLLWQRGSGP